MKFYMVEYVYLDENWVIGFAQDNKNLEKLLNEAKKIHSEDRLRVTKIDSSDPIIVTDLEGRLEEVFESFSIPLFGDKLLTHKRSF